MATVERAGEPRKASGTGPKDKGGLGSAPQQRVWPFGDGDERTGTPRVTGLSM